MRVDIIGVDHGLWTMKVTLDGIMPIVGRSGE